MASYYADSSVLVKRHVTENGTDWVRALMDVGAGNYISMSSLAIVEVASAFHRKHRLGELDAAQLATAITEFETIALHGYGMIDVTPDIVSAAYSLVARYPLRAYDAMQLATALAVQTALQASGLPALTLLASDRQLLAAAQAEGFTVDNPNLYPWG